MALKIKIEITLSEPVYLDKTNAASDNLDWGSVNLVTQILNIYLIIDFKILFCWILIKLLDIKNGEIRTPGSCSSIVSVVQRQSKICNSCSKAGPASQQLSEDKNTRVRWIWELIQNAKDVPNEFGKTRIRIEIMDDKFVFIHNGDAFRVEDLSSIVAQYSSNLIKI